MISINLLPWREALFAKHGRELARNFFLIFILSILVIYGAYILMATKIKKQRARNDFLQQQINILTTQAATFDALKKGRENLLADIKLALELQSDRVFIVHFFEELVKITPKNIYLTRAQREGNEIILEGRAKTHEDISQLIKNLSDSSILTQPVLREIKTSTYGNRKYIEFRLQIKKKTGDVATTSNFPFEGKLR